MSAGSERLKDEGSHAQVVIAGATAGLVSRFCIAPLDVVKIRLQLQVHSKPDPQLPTSLSTYRGALPTLRAIVQHEGLTALWKGNLPASHLYVLYSSLQFTFYHAIPPLLHRLAPLPPPLESFIAGALAGGLATTLTYPLDLLRTRFAAQSSHAVVYPSLRASLRSIYASEGARGFFRGLPAAVLQIVPYMGLFFASYESLRRPLADLPYLPLGSSDATAGTIASILAKTGVFPLDLVRKRLQVQGPSRGRYVYKYAHGGEGVPLYRGGVVRTLGEIVRREGVRGLYRGLGVGLVKAAPGGAVTMWVYEGVLGGLKSVEEDVT